MPRNGAMNETTEQLSLSLEVFTDANIREFLTDADLPSLLVTLAQLTGDAKFIADELQPPLELGAANTPPQGGLTQAQQERARSVAFEAIRELRDGGLPAAPKLPLLDLVRFFCRDQAEDYLDLLAHELDVAPGEGSPKWTAQEIAPERSFRVAVIGAGLSGLAAAQRAREAGLEVTIFEKNPEVGGTWFENHYPGCRLDTHNYAYAYSFAQKPDWPQYFSRQPEILKYFSEFADRNGLREYTKFSTRVTAATFDESTAKWRVSYTSGAGTSEELFDAIFSGVGQLNVPQLPKIEGIDRFHGESWHTARWNHEVDLTGKRVAVIGTGASAFQVIPAIAEQVGTLDVYQRNAPWMYPTPRYLEDINDGQIALFRAIPGYGKWYRFLQFWTAVEGRRKYAIADPNWHAADSVSAENDVLRAELTEYFQEQFGDRPDLLEHVIPTYPPGAKRLLRDDGTWARTLKRENVNLITAGITRITEQGIEGADGVLREVDVIIYGTGFAASDFLASYDVQGLAGIHLRDYWDGDAQAYLGITVPNFPNLFLLYGPNTNLVVNGSSVFLVELAVEFALEAIRTVIAKGADYIDVTEAAYTSFTDDLDAESRRMVWGAASVSSWYKNRKGRVTSIWPYPLVDYWHLTRSVNPEHHILGSAQDDTAKAGELADVEATAR